MCVCMFLALSPSLFNKIDVLASPRGSSKLKKKSKEGKENPQLRVRAFLFFSFLSSSLNGVLGYLCLVSVDISLCVCVSCNPQMNPLFALREKSGSFILPRESQLTRYLSLSHTHTLI